MYVFIIIPGLVEKVGLVLVVDWEEHVLGWARSSAMLARLNLSLKWARSVGLLAQPGSHHTPFLANLRSREADSDCSELGNELSRSEPGGPTQAGFDPWWS